MDVEADTSLTLRRATEDLLSLQERGLWHQFTATALSLLNDEKAIRRSDTEFLNLFYTVIQPNIHRMKFLSVAKLAVAAGRQIPLPKDRVQFLREIFETLRHSKVDDVESFVYLQSEIASILVTSETEREGKEGKEILLECKEKIEALEGLDGSVYSIFYNAQMEHDHTFGTFSEYYRTALLYLAYTNADQIDISEQRRIAFSVGIAALLAEDVHNFGELLMHPAVESLRNTRNEWLLDLLLAFHRGDLDAYERVIVKEAESMQAVPILIQNVHRLNEKIQLMCLMEHIFNTFPGNQMYSFEEISGKTNVPADEVDFLILKALALGLIRGKIDGVEKIVTVSWIQPHVLDKKQLSVMEKKIEDWIEKVKDTRQFVLTQDVLSEPQ
eukprot:TRINITY_DN1644_c0_g1_i1.p1 TRINITY_DN1644_c0_g1~~TRINITY_DN1644_c0_g1_i1.p1  ORF type:complete len:385 (-),score=112.34 TRINITY_DN1644_c0_g1_i1:1179-2333(-)